MDPRVKPTDVRLKRRWTKCMAWIQLCFARTRLNEARRAPSHAVPIYGVRRVAESGAAGLVRADGAAASSRPSEAHASAVGPSGDDGHEPAVWSGQLAGSRADDGASSWGAGPFGFGAGGANDAGGRQRRSAVRAVRGGCRQVGGACRGSEFAARSDPADRR